MQTESTFSNMNSNFKPGDRVRVTYEARFDAHDIYQHGDARVVGDDMESARVPVGATIELLESADHPSKNKPGAYRTAHRDGATIVKMRDNLWAVPREGEVTPLYYSDADVAEIAGPLVGVLPGTPAADQP